MSKVAWLLAKAFPSMGTRSVLYGAHCFFLHPWFVAAAWTKLYGFPRDIRLWVAFFVHDLGYIGKVCMDDEEGERHPELGARVMSALFDRRRLKLPPYVVTVDAHGGIHDIGPWGQFALLHSRFLAKRMDLPYSHLCIADKLAFALTPRWLYLPMVRATGEIREYMQLAEQRTANGEPKYASMLLSTSDDERWFNDVRRYMVRWVARHRDGRQDTWTPTTAMRTASRPSGVWQ